MNDMYIDSILKKKARIEKVYQEHMKYYDAVLKTYERFKNAPFGEYPKAAFIAYIKCRDSVEAAKLLSDAGMRFGNRKFKSGDISDAIRKLDIDDAELQKVARALLKCGRTHEDKF